MTPRRRFRWAAVALGLAVALAAAEGALRVTGAGAPAPRRHEYNFLRREGDAFWVFDLAKPPSHVWDGDPYGTLPPGARMTYPIDACGLRGPPPDPARPKALVVGDSFTFGEGVAYEDTFCARLETALASVASPPPQALNAGVPGYGTIEQAARLPHWLEQFRPRAVVLVFVPNDPIPLDDAFATDDLLGSRAEEPGLRLARLVRGVLGRSAADERAEAWYRSYYFGERAERWQAAREALGAMQRLAKGSEARFGVVLFPLLHRLAERPFERIHAAVSAECASRGIPFLDLAGALAEEDERALWVHPSDHHPNARAHAIAARAMAPFVASLLE